MLYRIKKMSEHFVFLGMDFIRQTDKYLHYIDCLKKKISFKQCSAPPMTFYFELCYGLQIRRQNKK